MTSKSQLTAKPNRLINEKSPYLLQHAHNPVDWYPWGEEAFARAKAEGKPIFLSVGYSTCHWCHVMAHESFEDPAVAAVMNGSYVNIKVDREERPDVDAVYMAAVQTLTGGGGWPMSIWLTPELKPFYGGTYFPPDDRYGRPSFVAVLTQLAELYHKDSEKVTEASNDLSRALHEFASGTLGKPGDPPRADDALATTARSLKSMHDAALGGFGPAPKFPMPTYLRFLLHYEARTADSAALDMVENTMRHMARGGIYDQLGGGFARYSTDERWIVPHFEKMLYDNAQLISVAASLVRRTRREDWIRLTRDAANYVLRDLRHPDGGFFSAEDADSEGHEGTFYLWTLAQIKQAFPEAADEPSAEAFIYRYGVSVAGNFTDPHTRESGRNVLVETRSIEETAKHIGKSVPETIQRLDTAKNRLFELRSRRVRPHRDDKILAEWNGLMISALAQAGTALADGSYLDRARDAARFLKTHLYDPNEKRLYRSWREGDRRIEGQQADYAMMIQGLMDLFEAIGEPEWLEWAIDLQSIQNDLFFDSEAGGYFMNTPRADLLVRMKDDGDNVIPSGNSIAALNGLRLGHLTDRKDFSDKAEATLMAFATHLAQRPVAVATMVLALDFAERGNGHVVVLGPTSRADMREMLSAAHAHRPPNATVVPVDPETSQAKLAKILAFVKPMVMVDGRATAYVCVNYACRRPTTNLDDLREQLTTIQK